MREVRTVSFVIKFVFIAESRIEEELTVTPGHWVTPPPISLTDSSVRGAGERHPLLASEGHHRVQGRPAPLQPPVGQDTRGPTVDF